MRIIFCNVTYLRYYDGRVVGELKPKTGGRWVRENEDAHEKWNFLNIDGMCYGYVQANCEEMHIEKLDKVYKQQDAAEDITVVWCASDDVRGTVVIGWYEHATVHRNEQYAIVTPISGIDRAYWFETKAENAYLLPEEYRTFEIGRASKTGVGTGFGQANYWYAESKYAKENVIPAVLEFIENNRDKRMNVLTSEFEEPKNLEPLTESEWKMVESIGEEEDKEFLPYAYRIYANEPTADNAYQIAATLRNLFQYKMSIPWYEKILEFEPDDWETMGILAYMYSQCEEYEKFIATAKRLLEIPEAKEPDFRDEIYCMLADGHYFSGDIATAVFWQEKILKESKNKELIVHTKKLKKNWEQML